MKTCSGPCGLDKELTEFNKHNGKKDGAQSVCRECNQKDCKKYYRQHKVKIRRQIHAARSLRRAEIQRSIFDFLRSHPCVDCGQTDPVVLEFDHVSGDKTDHIGSMLSKVDSWTRIEAEIKKCSVRCANCHRRKTSRDRNDYRWRLCQTLKADETI